jgi:hypothetical protein
MDIKKFDLLTIGKWLATAIVVAGAALSSVNIYPAGIITMNVGALVWLIVAWFWREWSILTINGALLLIYTVGLVYNYLK